MTYFGQNACHSLSQIKILIHFENKQSRYLITFICYFKKAIQAKQGKLEKAKTLKNLAFVDVVAADVVDQ